MASNPETAEQRQRKDQLIQGCWEWQKSCSSSGYGQFTKDKKYWNTHRYVYQKCKGDIPDGMLIRHMCHSRKCCNPEHLELGTEKDNYNDSITVHNDVNLKKRGKWKIAETTYPTVREASSKTGLHQGTIIKYTEDGVFNIDKYLIGCKIAKVKPKLGVD